MASLFELAGSVKEAIFAALHAVTAEPFRVTPPEAVVYQVLIIVITLFSNLSVEDTFSLKNITVTEVNKA